jgi:flavin reductase (DIM6/NTAB) family NADH-FMN oxidoreductase RutF
MAKKLWKPGTMLNPVPVVMISCRDKEGKDNIITVAWAGTICSDPPMLSVSIRPERHSYNIIKETGEFCVNLTDVNTCRATDYCGVKSGKNVDKFKETNLAKENANFINVPLIKECPVNIECKVKDILELGSHHMFIAEIVGVNVNGELLDTNDKLRLEDANLVAYSHGKYYSLGEELGFFGYSVAKKDVKRG